MYYCTLYLASIWCTMPEEGLEASLEVVVCKQEEVKRKDIRKTVLDEGLMTAEEGGIILHWYWQDISLIIMRCYCTPLLGASSPFPFPNSNSVPRFRFISPPHQSPEAPDFSLRWAYQGQIQFPQSPNNTQLHL